MSQRTVLRANSDNSRKKEKVTNFNKERMNVDSVMLYTVTVCEIKIIIISGLIPTA